jgi:hypothetical protein
MRSARYCASSVPRKIRTGGFVDGAVPGRGGSTTTSGLSRK